MRDIALLAIDSDVLACIAIDKYPRLNQKWELLTYERGALNLFLSLDKQVLEDYNEYATTYTNMQWS